MLPANRIIEREKLRTAIRSNKPIDALVKLLYQQTKTSIETKADFEKYLLAILENNKSPIDELDSLQCPVFYRSGDLEWRAPHVEDVLKRAYENSRHLCKTGFLDKRSVDKLKAARERIVNAFNKLTSKCSRQVPGSLEKLRSLQYMIAQFVARIVAVFSLKLASSPLLYDHFTLEQRWVIQSLAQAAIDTIAKLTFTLDSMNAEFLVMQFKKRLEKCCSEMDSGTYEMESDEYKRCFGVEGEMVEYFAPKQKLELKYVRAREGYLVSYCTFSQGVNKSGAFRREVNKILKTFPRLLRTRHPLLNEEKFIEALKIRDRKAESYYHGRDQYLALLCEAYKKAFLLPREKRSFFSIGSRTDTATLSAEKQIQKEIYELLANVDERYTMQHLQVRYRLNRHIRDLKIKIVKANQKRDCFLAKDAALRTKLLASQASAEVVRTGEKKREISLAHSSIPSIFQPKRMYILDMRATTVGLDMKDGEVKQHCIFFHARKASEKKRDARVSVVQIYQNQIASAEAEIRDSVIQLMCEEVYSAGYRYALSLKSATSPADDSVLRFFALYYPNLIAEILDDVITVLKESKEPTVTELAKCERKFKLMLYLGHEAYRLCEIIFAQHIPATTKESQEAEGISSCQRITNDFSGIIGLEVMTIPGLSAVADEAIANARKDSKFVPLYEMEAAIECAFANPQSALRLVDTMKREYRKRFSAISTPAPRLQLVWHGLIR